MTKKIVDDVNRDPRFVTLRVDLWEEQQREREAYRRYLRELDPCRLGLWGPIDDNDDA